MSSQRFSLPDARRSRLRAIVAKIDGEIARLPGSLATDEGGRTPNGLRASWADLVEQLELGPEPELRICPACKHLGMRAATLCGYCWTRLSPFSERDHLPA